MTKEEVETILKSFSDEERTKFIVDCDKLVVQTMTETFKKYRSESLEKAAVATSMLFGALLGAAQGYAEVFAITAQSELLARVISQAAREVHELILINNMQEVKSQDVKGDAKDDVKQTVREADIEAFCNLFPHKAEA